MRRAIALGLSVLMCTALFSGCSRETDEGGKKVTLKVVTQFGGEDPNTELFNTMIKEWENKTGNKVTNNSDKADNEWKSKVIADFTTGGEPDVMFFFNGTVAEPILDKIVTVDEIQAEDPEYGKNIRSAVMNAAGNLDAEGRPISVPMTGIAEGLFCNKTLFAQYNLELPSDWDSFMQAVETFKNNGVIPIAASLGGEAHYFFDHLLLAVGGEEALAVNPTTEAEVPASWAKGLGLLKTLYDAGAFPKDTASIKGDDARIYFRRGEAAMYLDGSWFSVVDASAEGAKVTEEDVEVVPFPSYTESTNKPGTVLSGYTSGWYISRKCWEDKDKRAAAIDFVKSMSSDEGITRFAEANGGFPASDGVVVDESKMTVQKRQFDALLKAAPVTPGVLQDNLQKAAFEVYLNNATKLARGEITPEEVIREMVKENQPL